ncbi:zinc finger protein 26 [Trichonephila clavipes]|nr:zinc finger protein 26 [Trichonephila clavipes]
MDDYIGLEFQIESVDPDFAPESEILLARQHTLLWNEEQFNQNQFKSGNIPLFNPEVEVQVLQSNHLDAIVGRNSENKSESVELTREGFESVPINAKLILYESSLKSDPLNENNYFLFEIKKPSFEKNYCEKCFKTFKRRYDFLKHKSVNTDVKDFRNGDSKKNDYQEEQLSEHNRRNTEEKSVQCGICEKFSKKPLARHMRLHNGTKTFRCNVCGKSFAQSSNLTCHMRTHTGEKPFQCKMRQKCFLTSTILIRHVRTHT